MCTDVTSRDEFEYIVKFNNMNPGKFFGACNQVKADMDRCFRAEKERKRAANLV
jgi:hypothetical protein